MKNSIVVHPWIASKYRLKLHELFVCDCDDQKYHIYLLKKKTKEKKKLNED